MKHVPIDIIGASDNKDFDPNLPPEYSDEKYLFKDEPEHKMMRMVHGSILEPYTMSDPLEATAWEKDWRRMGRA